VPGKPAWSLFEGARGPDALVRVGVWDRVCVPGQDEKDGQSTEFTVETLSQMIDNFLDRHGDPIPLDANHLSNYTHVTGQPAPALAFYGALAIVWGGKIVRLERGRDTPPCPGSSYVSPSTATEDGIDITRDGLWCFRNEVTEIGQELLKGFKLVSPTFLSEGTRRDGTPVGYCLAAVAATNTPWQSATEISFDSQPAGSTAPAEPQKEQSMSKFAKYAKFAGAADGADDAAIKQALAAKMAGLAEKAVSEEDFDLKSAAEEMDEACKLMEGDAEMATESSKLQKMAAKFRRMSSFDAADGDKDEDKKPSEMDSDDKEAQKMAADEGKDAKMAAMSATIETLSSRLAKFERSEQERAAAEEKVREAKFSQLADEAVNGGYPKTKRDALIKFARTDFDGARSLVESFLPKAAPGHLFDRYTGAGGAPAGQGRASREDSAPAKPRIVKSPLGNFVETDGAFAQKAREFAASEEPAVKAKIDALLPAEHRPMMFHRLLAAQKVVTAEHPDLAESAE
jgi:hypothetical protein